MKWLAPAKINLSLRVLGRRADGFHALETLMVPLDLADEITLEPKGGVSTQKESHFELICSDPTLPTGLDNLALRAAELFRARAAVSLPPTRIILRKTIPHGAGLGGGSSDAATVLLALNEENQAGLNVRELAEMAAELGSDVPFFVYRSAAICRGRGELVEPVAFAREVPLLLLKPPFPVPTPWAYKHWASSRELPGVLYAAQPFAWGDAVNDLERPVFEKYLLLAELKMWLLNQPEVSGALLSGSGSTTVAILRETDGAEPVAVRAREQFGTLWTCACQTVANPAAMG